MTKTTQDKKWLSMAIFLIIMMATPAFSYGNQPLVNGNEGSQLVNILANMQKTFEGVSQGVGRLSSNI
jgi:hypothetical protein